MENELNYSVEDLKDFSKKAKNFENNDFKELNEAKRISISIKIGKPLVSSRDFPNEHLFKSFLMDFRCFLTEKTDSKNINIFNFKKVCDFFIRINYQKEKVKKYKENFESCLNNNLAGVKLSLNEKPITKQKIFHSILNGEYFHQECRRDIEEIKSNPVIENHAKMEFVTTIDNLRSIVCSFNNEIVKEYLSDMSCRKTEFIQEQSE